MRSFLAATALINSIYAQTASIYASDQEYYEFANPFPETSGALTTSFIKVAYPVNVCTKEGNQIYQSNYQIYQCTGDGGILWGGCKKTDSTCSGPTDPSNPDFSCNQELASFPKSSYAIDTSGSGGPNGETCPDNENSATINYMQINFHCSQLTDEQSPRDCPNDNAAFSD